jgi:Spy/CpxP family protein refolding chaperone
MTKWLPVAVVSVAGLALTAVVAAGGMHHIGMSGHGHGHGQGHGEGLDWFVNGALDDLGATEAQRTQVLAVKDRLAAQMQKLHGEHDVVHAAFLREWKADKMDAAQLHQLVDARLPELRATLHQMVDGVAEIHDTLTPEQRRRLVEKVQEMHGPR